MERNFYANIIEGCKKKCKGNNCDNSILESANEITIEDWLSKLNAHKLESYKILNNGSVDLEGDVVISEEMVSDITKIIPFKINKIKGNLTILTDLKSFKNFPEEVSGDIYIKDCYSPESFKNFPKKCKRIHLDNDDLNLTKIKSLDGFPLICKDKLITALLWANLSWKPIVNDLTKEDLKDLNNFKYSFELSIYIKILKDEKVLESDLKDLINSIKKDKNSLILQTVKKDLMDLGLWE